MFIEYLPNRPLTNKTLFATKAFVDGQWVDARSGATVAVYDPATGSEIGKVPDCGADDTKLAVDAAAAAFPAWSATPAAERAALLEKWCALILENAEDLATIMTAEQGKPLAEARGEVRYGASFVKWFAEEARRSYGDIIPVPSRERRLLVLKQPIGVAAAITPWNFPNAMITRKCAPALAAGCTVVIKPSELTPYSALALAALAARAGFPRGVINVVTGMPTSIGAELTSNPTVRKLSFTGSTRIGKLLLRQCSDTMKRTSFELGGNAPFIVFDDADIPLAVDGLMASKFRNGGQTCVCANRILVQDAIYDTFLATLSESVKRLVVGNGFADGVTIGPLINSAAVDKVRRHISDALSHGARAVVGGALAESQDQFVQPVVLSGASIKMQLASEETFGPVAPLFRFKHEEEAIEIANATPYGLSAYYFTQDMHRSWRVAERLEAGIVGLNTGVVSMEVAPFGGVKESGLGREGSKYGIDEFIEVKALHIGGLKIQ